jgi:type 1 fimbria pilin
VKALPIADLLDTAMKKLIQLVMALTVATVSFAAHSQCIGYGTQSTYYRLHNLPEFDGAVINSAPVGTVLFTSVLDTSTAGSTTINTAATACNGAQRAQPKYYKALGSFNTVSTNFPGIGMRLRWDGGPLRIPSGYLHENLTSRDAISATQSWNWSTGTVTMELVKTGTIPTGSYGLASGGQAVISLHLPFVGFVVAPIASARIVMGSTSNVPVIVVKDKPTCSVSASSASLDVPLGNVPRTTFTGLGSVSKEKPFNLVLECSGGDAGESRGINITLTDPASSGGNTSTTLPLTPGSTASGVGIQVLRDNGTLVSYGPDSAAVGNPNQWRAGTVMGAISGTETFTIPLKARYVQTAPDVTAGIADGLATFTMSYD